MYKLPKKRRISTSILILPVFILLTVLLTRKKITYAAKFNDGTWTQSGSPGTTTITFTNTGALVAGDDIVLSFPSTADVNASGTNISCTGQGTPTRTNNDTNNTVTVTLDAGISGSTSITISMTDGLTSYTTSTYAMDSVGINTQDNSDELIDFGLALMTNDNTTTITASVPLFVNMTIDTTAIDLGTLSTAAVSEADQTYTFNCNNSSGITVQIASDGTLDDGSNTVDYVSDGTVTAGSEEYGISIDNTTPGLVIDTDYAPGDNDIIQAANNIAISTSTVSSATFDVNYKASISGNTVAGDYEQVVTVTVATNA